LTAQELTEQEQQREMTNSVIYFVIDLIGVSYIILRINCSLKATISFSMVIFIDEHCNYPIKAWFNCYGAMSIISAFYYILLIIEIRNRYISQYLNFCGYGVEV
jgi:hypothetical protein